MSFADVMLFSTEIDVFRFRFRGILEYGKLNNSSGYKFRIQNNECLLDPPSFFQGLTRWYYGHSQQDFEKFLNDNKILCDSFLERILESGIPMSRAYAARKFLSYVCVFAYELSTSCNLCRNVYPTRESIRNLLLNYYHDLRSWIKKMDTLLNNKSNM